MASFFVTILSLASSECYGGFLIKLKNGRTISAQHYQIEGGQLLLFVDSGIFKLSRQEVQTIEEDAQLTKAISMEQTEQTFDQTKTDGRNSAIQGSEAKSLLERKAELQERLEEAKKAYFDSTEKTEKERTREEMISLSKELLALEEQVTSEAPRVQAAPSGK